MKFSLAKEHRDFFNMHGMLEIEGIFTKEQSEILYSQILDAFLKRGITLRKSNSTVLFKEGPDLSRENSDLQKIIYKKNLGEVAAELGFYPPLRVGYDRFIPSGYRNKSIKPLEAMGYMQNILCGYIICLKGPEKDESEDLPSPFSKTPGNVVFIRPDFPIDFSLLNEREGYEYLLATFVGPKALYYYNEEDEHTHFLKKLGYVFGDRVTEVTHPTVCRR